MSAGLEEQTNWKLQFHARSQEVRRNMEDASKAIKLERRRRLAEMSIRWMCRPAVIYKYRIGPKKPCEEALDPATADAFALTKRVRDTVVAICRKHRISVEDIVSDRRTRIVVDARHEAFHTVKEMTGWSLPRIGKYFGNKDHTTVLHGCKRYAAILAERARRAKV